MNVIEFVQPDFVVASDVLFGAYRRGLLIIIPAIAKLNLASWLCRTNLTFNHYLAYTKLELMRIAEKGGQTAT